MSGRMRLSAARAALVIALAGSICAMSATVAVAYVTTDMNDFNLTESTSFYGAPTQYHISSGTDGWVSYRWLDSPSKSTVIGASRCSDLADIGTTVTIPAGNTNYQNLFNQGAGYCFAVHGRTSAGQGSMSLYDGRIQR